VETPRAVDEAAEETDTEGSLHTAVSIPRLGGSDMFSKAPGLGQPKAKTMSGAKPNAEQVERARRFLESRGSAEHVLELAYYFAAEFEAGRRAGLEEAIARITIYSVADTREDRAVAYAIERIRARLTPASTESEKP
jgi:hypothetical protein